MGCSQSSEKPPSPSPRPAPAPGIKVVPAVRHRTVYAPNNHGRLVARVESAKVLIRVRDDDRRGSTTTTNEELPSSGNSGNSGKPVMVRSRSRESRRGSCEERRCSGSRYESSSNDPYAPSPPMMSRQLFGTPGQRFGTPGSGPELPDSQLRLRVTWPIEELLPTPTSELSSSVGPSSRGQSSAGTPSKDPYATRAPPRKRKEEMVVWCNVEHDHDCRLRFTNVKSAPNWQHYPWCPACGGYEVNAKPF